MSKNKNVIFAPAFTQKANMVVVAQLVRALDCGSRGRGFKSHHPPKITEASSKNDGAFFVYTTGLKKQGSPRTLGVIHPK